MLHKSVCRILGGNGRLRLAAETDAKDNVGDDFIPDVVLGT